MAGEVDVADIVDTPNRIRDADRQVVDILTPTPGSPGQSKSKGIKIDDDNQVVILTPTTCSPGQSKSKDTPPVIRLTDTPKRKREGDVAGGSADDAINLNDDGDAATRGKCSATRWRGRKDHRHDIIFISPDSTSDGRPSPDTGGEADWGGRQLFLTGLQSLEEATTTTTTGQELGSGPEECSLNSANSTEEPCAVFEDRQPSEPVIHHRDDSTAAAGDGTSANEQGRGLFLASLQAEHVHQIAEGDETGGDLGGGGVAECRPLSCAAPSPEQPCAALEYKARTEAGQTLTSLQAEHVPKISAGEETGVGGAECRPLSCAAPSAEGPCAALEYRVPTEGGQVLTSLRAEHVHQIAAGEDTGVGGAERRPDSDDCGAERPCAALKDRERSEATIAGKDSAQPAAESGALRASAGETIPCLTLPENCRVADEEAGKTSSHLRSKRRKSSSHSQMQGPRVEVTFRNLSRRSKWKLEEVLREWSVWQTANESAESATAADPVESGSRVYFPAMQTEQENGQMGLHFFWEDKPGVSSEAEDTGEVEEGEVEGAQSGICGPESAWIAEDRFNMHYEAYYSIPTYERGTNHVISMGRGDSVGNGGDNGSAGKGREAGLTYIEVPQEAPRCFNCGSYNHNLKECPKPRDNAVINATRQKKMGTRANPRLPSRYHGPSSNTFADLKPGVLSERVRQALGMKEVDPPPWLSRMRELGYPPGYLDTGNDIADLTIFDEEDGEDSVDRQGDSGGATDRSLQWRESAGDKECERTLLPNIAKEPSGGTREEPIQTVLFPGINAPIPQGADESKWMPWYRPQPHLPERSDRRQWSPIRSAAMHSSRSQSYGDVSSPPRTAQGCGARGGVQESYRYYPEDITVRSLSSPTQLHRSLSDSQVRYPSNGNAYPQMRPTSDISSPRHSALLQIPFSSWRGEHISNSYTHPPSSPSHQRFPSSQTQQMSAHTDHSSNNQPPHQQNPASVGAYQHLHSQQQSHADRFQDQSQSQDQSCDPSHDQFHTQAAQKNGCFYVPAHVRRVYQSMGPPLSRSLKLPPPVQNSPTASPIRLPHGMARASRVGRDGGSDSDMDIGD